ncbi:hypothetical protein [Kordia sp.]|uniref:hypothetical protein n=1 Tax=Kordia sp. TaxID=1965332 RepID=UPI003D6A0DEC
MKIHTSRKFKTLLQQHNNTTTHTHSNTHTTENHQKLEIMKRRSLKRLNHKKATVSNLKSIKCGLRADSSMPVILAHLHNDMRLNAVGM